MRRLYPEVLDLDDPESLESHFVGPPGRNLRAVFAISLDGVVELDGKSASLGSPADRQVFMANRASADVVLVGARTARIERYGPVKLDAGAMERRRMRNRPPLPRLAVASASGALDPDLRLWSSEPPVVLLTTAFGARTDSVVTIGDRAEVVVCGDELLDTGKALDELAARELEHVVCEGGPTLLRSFMDAGQVDEMCLTFSPVVAGVGHLGLLGTEALAAPVPFRLGDLIEGDGMLIALYRRR